MAMETWPFYLDMETKEILEQVSDIAAGTEVIITVDIRPVNTIHRIAQSIRLAPKKRVFIIGHLVLGTLIRVSKLLLSLDVKTGLLDKDKILGSKMLDASYNAIASHGETLAKIVALSIHNNSKPVSKDMVKFIERNFTSSEMLGVLKLVLRQMDLSNFLSSIISVRGLNVLEIPEPVIATNASEAEVSL